MLDVLATAFGIVVAVAVFGPILMLSLLSYAAAKYEQPRE